MPVLVQVRDHVATLTLRRPEARNAWGDDYNEGLEAALARFADDPAVRCVVLTGDPEGGAFSAGAYLKDERVHSAGDPAAFIEGLPRWRRFVTHLLNEFPKPVVGAVNGHAIGIGCIASFCCDLIVASDRAEWLLPQVRLGILPAYGGAARIWR